MKKEKKEIVRCFAHIIGDCDCRSCRDGKWHYATGDCECTCQRVSLSELSYKVDTTCVSLPKELNKKYHPKEEII